MPKYIEEDRLGQSPYHQDFCNAAIFGPAPVVEMTNPDGEKVSGSVLRGTIGLYIDLPAGPSDAEKACRRFIDQVASLLDAVKAGPP